MAGGTTARGQVPAYAGVYLSLYDLAYPRSTSGPLLLPDQDSVPSALYSPPIALEHRDVLRSFPHFERGHSLQQGFQQGSGTV